MEHRGMRALAYPIALAALMASPTAGLAAPPATLTQISHDPYTNVTSQHQTQVEPDSLAFGNSVVVAVQTGRFFDGGASNVSWATSTNGGSAWTHGFLPGTTVFATPKGNFSRVSDPAVAYDARHNAWLISTLGLKNGSQGPIGAAVLVNRSENGGTVWGNPVTVHAVSPTGNLDKEWVVCDNTATSPFYGRCYTEWDDAGNNGLLQMSTSTDGGKTWGPAKTSPNHACVIGGQPLVQPSGTVIVVIDDCFGSTILAFRSTDGGGSWTNPMKAAIVISDGHPGGIRSPDLPSAEIDKSGKVYAAWTDCRFEANCHAGTNDVVLTSSADGVNWTAPKRVPADPVGSGVDHLIPGLAVDRSTSGSSAHLALAYYYFPTISCTSSTCMLNVGFVSSRNGGASWSAGQQLAGPMKMSWLPVTNQGVMVGDYISTSIVPGSNFATPIFEVAHAPTAATPCSSYPPAAKDCNQATYSTRQPVAAITGGSLLPDGTAGDATVSNAAQGPLTAR